MKALINCIFFFLFTLHSTAQSDEIISLKKDLKEGAISQTEQCDIYYKLAFEYQFIGLDSMQHYLNLSEELAYRLNYTLGKANAYYAKGILHSLRYKNTEAISHFKQALECFLEENKKKGISKTYNALGISYAKTRAFSQAIHHFNKALDLKKEMGDQLGVANTYTSIAMLHSKRGNFLKALDRFNQSLSIYTDLQNKEKMAYTSLSIGGVHLNMGNYLNALEHFYKAKYIYQDIGKKSGEIQCLNNIGSVFRVQENYNKALEHYKQVETHYTKEKQSHLLANTQINIGNVFRGKQELDTAFLYYSKALEQSRHIGFKMGESTALYGMSNVYLDRSQYKLALETLKQALELKQGLKDKEGISHCYLNIAEVYTKLNTYDKALNSAQKGLKVAQEQGLKALEKRGHQLLTQLYKEKGNFKTAFYHQQAYIVLKDSLLNADHLKKLTALEYEYKYKKQIERAEESLKDSEDKWLEGVVVFAVVLILSLLVILVLLLRNIKKKNQQLLLEQQLLRSQMNPHFVFNALGILQGIILQKEYKKAITYLGKFSLLLRSILEHSRAKMLTLDRELSTVNTFIELQNLGVEIPYRYSLKSEVNHSSVLIPSMLLQPFVENAIVHGFRLTDTDKHIQISIRKEGLTLVCIIEDNGIGIEQTQTNKRDNESLSTKISRERVELLSKTYNLQASIQITDLKAFNKKGTRVTIVLPYKEKKK